MVCLLFRRHGKKLSYYPYSIRIAGYRQSAPNQLEFVVEDTGIGMAPEQHEIIFERFRQAEHNTNHKYGGTGLGLNIAGNLVQLMGGDIWVKSTVGVGSEFYFTIEYKAVASKQCDAEAA